LITEVITVPILALIGGCMAVAELNNIEDWINNRPMKILGYKTPNQKFYELQQKFMSVAS